MPTIKTFDNETDRLTSIFDAQAKFYNLPAEDLVGYIVVTVRALPDDECTEENNHEVSIDFGGYRAVKMVMLDKLINAVMSDQGVTE